jgi:SAM-dependent methyltransferase
VVATDLDTRFLEAAAQDGVAVLRHDILNDPLEPASFDLIHTRLLLMHLPERERALDNMLRALRPGGTLLVEDFIIGVDPV